MSRHYANTSNGDQFTCDSKFIPRLALDNNKKMLYFVGGCVPPHNLHRSYLTNYSEVIVTFDSDLRINLEEQHTFAFYEDHDPPLLLYSAFSPINRQHFLVIHSERGTSPCMPSEMSFSINLTTNPQTFWIASLT